MRVRCSHLQVGPEVFMLAWCAATVVAFPRAVTQLIPQQASGSGRGPGGGTGFGGGGAGFGGGAGPDVDEDPPVVKDPFGSGRAGLFGGGGGAMICSSFAGFGGGGGTFAFALSFALAGPTGGGASPPTPTLFGFGGAFVSVAAIWMKPSAKASALPDAVAVSRAAAAAARPAS